MWQTRAAFLMIGAALVALSASALTWLAIRPETIIAQPANPIQDVPKVHVPPPKTIQVYGPKAKTRLSLPVAVVEDKKKHVAASTTVPPDGHAHTITTVIDTDTGEFQTYDTEEPLPLLSRADETAIAVGIVVKDSATTWRVKARRDIIKIKQLRTYAELQIDGDRQWSAGAYVEWRF